MYSYLKDNPQVGFLSGLWSGIVLFFREMFTNDHVLKIVSGVAIWAGCMVAVLTLVVWMIRVYDVLKSKIKHQQQNGKADNN